MTIDTKLSGAVRFALALNLARLTTIARAGIYQWEYVNPGDPSQGKQQSLVLTPGGAGVDAVPKANLSGLNLTNAYLIGANLNQADLTTTILTNADLSQANITDTLLDRTTLTNANLTGANIRAHDSWKLPASQRPALFHRHLPVWRPERLLRQRDEPQRLEFC